MSKLQEIGKQMAAIESQAKAGITQLKAFSDQIDGLMPLLQKSIHGSNQQSYHDLISQLSNAKAKLTNAIMALSGVSITAKTWLNEKLNSGAFLTHEGPTPSSNITQKDVSSSLKLQSCARISGPHTFLDDLKAVNPNFFKGQEWQENCQRCVAVYEARRRGYDVTAAPLADDNDPLLCMRHPLGWPHVFIGGELEDCTANSGTAARERVIEKMQEWGDGARAIVRVQWKSYPGGHVFIAEQVDGHTRFVDPQTNCADAFEHFEDAKGNSVFCMRIDNLSFSELFDRCVA